MRKIAFVFALLALTVACKKNSDKEKTTDSDIDMVPTVQEECYEYRKDGNTIYMHLKKEVNAVTGNLDYAYSEKDSNTGTFSGTIKNDILIAVYTFTSEGMESKREIAFQVKDKTLIEGYGEVEEKNGTVTFKSPDKLVFNSGMPLAKVDCKK